VKRENRIRKTAGAAIARDAGGRSREGFRKRERISTQLINAGVKGGSSAENQKANLPKCGGTKDLPYFLKVRVGGKPKFKATSSPNQKERRLKPCVISGNNIRIQERKSSVKGKGATKS